MYGILGTIHCFLFQEYMKVNKDGKGRWKIAKCFRRYVSVVSISLKVWESTCNTREFMQRHLRRQRKRQKSNRLNLSKQQLYTCSMLFSVFLCRHWMTTTWKCLISRFVEDVNTRQWRSLSFPELRNNFLEFISRKICQNNVDELNEME